MKKNDKKFGGIKKCYYFWSDFFKDIKSIPMRMKYFFLLIAFCCFGRPVFSQSGFADPLHTPFADNEIKTVPAFNSCSYYYLPSDGAAFRTEYKSTGETVWHEAHATVCDQPENIHKGSLFNLEEDTEYQVRMLAGSRVMAQTAFRTWTSAPRIAKTIDLSTLPYTANDGIVITEQGTPDGWIRYTAPDGWTVRRTSRDADPQAAVIVLKEARYIILENLVVEGGKNSSILVLDCDFVRILNCDISGWGRAGVQQYNNSEELGKYKDDEGKLINYDGGIHIRRSAATVVERCYIHDPRGRANSWVFSHPAGPQAIMADFTRGGNVIRWNDFVGSDEHRWNDIIEGLSNDSPTGGLYRDSDITGNYLAFGNDDGIELEGGGINLRFTGNKIEGTLAGVSTGANMVGPQYVVGNLIVNPGDEDGLTLMFFKNSHGTRQKGKRFMYNNTLHGFDRSSGFYTPYGNATPVNAGLGTMRNNIFVCNSSYNASEWMRAENFDNDLYWVNHELPASERYVASFRNYGQETNALVSDPLLVDPVAGDYRLSSGSPAGSKAAEVTGIIHKGDDLGAFFNGVTDIPLRPLTLTAAPAHVNFQATGGVTAVTLSLPADAVAPVTFQIRQNSVFDWFTVTPASGTIAPGETLQLTVAADPARLTGRPVFRGAFLVRTPNGLSRPVTVYAKGDYVEDKRPASAPNTVYLEAVSGEADRQIKIPDDGDYSLLARVSPNPASRGGSPRFDIKINGESLPSAAQSGYWYLRNDVGRVLYLSSFGQLKAGAHRVELKCVNQNVTVVEYIITDNPATFFIQETYKRQ